MSRGLLAGATDYSHQSFKDILADLDDWVESLEKAISFLSENKQQLESNNYWLKVDYDFRVMIDRELLFYKTSLEEISEIKTEMNSEIQSHHVSRLSHLGKTAYEFNINIGKIWHHNVAENATDYQNPDFKILEKIYSFGRNMAIDLMDLSNAAARLGDYVGRKEKVEKSEAGDKTNIINIKGDVSGNLILGDNNELGNKT